MDFTREPIIETIITPKEGCKLVVRSSKSAGQEEYFVDAVEVVAFGNALFFRSIERPKTFLVPASDYEVLEVREARMVLKNVGIDKAIKIGGGKEQAPRIFREPVELPAAPSEVSSQASVESPEALEAKMSRLDKRREKRRHNRRRRGKDEGALGEEQSTGSNASNPDSAFDGESAGTGAPAEKSNTSPPSFSSMLPPPPTLISETIARYRDNALFKDAFFSKEEDISVESIISETASSELPTEHAEEAIEALEMRRTTLEPSAFGSFDAPNEGSENFRFESENPNNEAANKPQEDRKNPAE